MWDFLFTYYAYKPAQLRRWHPGTGVTLADAPERAGWRWYAAVGDEVTPDAAAFAADKPELAALVESARDERSMVRNVRRGHGRRVLPQSRSWSHKTVVQVE